MGSYSTGRDRRGTPAQLTCVGRDLTGVTSPRVGLIALRATADRRGGQLVAKFDWFKMGEADTCLPGPAATRRHRRRRSPSRRPTPGRLVHHASVVHARRHRRNGRIGVASSEYRIDGGAWTPYTAAVSVTGEGTRVIDYRATDVAGKSQAFKSRTVKVDTANPTVTAVEDGPAGASLKTLTLTANDATSGVATHRVPEGRRRRFGPHTSAPISVSSVLAPPS